MTDGDSSNGGSTVAELPEETVVAIDDWLARGDDETVRWEGRPRIQTVIPVVVVGFAVVIVAVVTTTVNGVSELVVVGLVGPFLPTWSYPRVTNTRYVVTDRALYRKTGVLSRMAQRVSLDRVQNSVLSQGAAELRFGYGTISVEAAGGGAVRFEDVDDSGALRDRIKGHDDHDELPDTIEQWVAARDEVRTLRAAVE